MRTLSTPAASDLRIFKSRNDDNEWVYIVTPPDMIKTEDGGSDSSESLCSF